MKITNLVSDMTQILNEVSEEADKFEIKGNNAAGARVRKAMQQVKNMAQEIRLEVSAIKNERKGK